MAPVADTSYFPPLDRCLAGDTRLISWRTTYRALCDGESALANVNLEQFLNDSDTVSLLSKAVDPFPGPSQRSAQELDTRTAPINVSQNSNGHYKLDEIKADTKWLAQEMQVEELVALRMAVIEWQERSADQLLNTALNPPDASSGQVALASSALGKSSLNLAASTTTYTSRPALDFTCEDVRRRRLVDVYLSERNHLLKLSTDLVSRTAVSKSDIQGQHVGSLVEHERRDWIDELAKKVSGVLFLNQQHNLQGDQQREQEQQQKQQREQHEAFCTKCIDLIGSLLDRMRDLVKWPKWFQNNPDEAQVYVASQYNELVTLLRLLLANIYAFDGIPSATPVKKWFLVMGRSDYLQDQMTIFGDSGTAQLLASMISVEILKLQLVIAEIQNAAGISDAKSNMQGSLYIFDDACMSTLSNGFYEAATASIACAAPAIYAWGIMTTVIGHIAQAHREGHEKRLANAEGSLSEGRATGEWKSEFERLYFDDIAIREWEISGSTTSATFMTMAVDRMDVYNWIATFGGAANATFDSQNEAATGFICKEALLDLMREGLGGVTYDTPILDAVLATLSPAEFCSASSKQSRVLAGKLLHDDGLFRPLLVDIVLFRYPYEISPFLRLFTALASAQKEKSRSSDLPEVVTELDNLQTFTQSAYVEFKDYTVSRAARGDNTIQLSADLPIFVRMADRKPGQSLFQMTPHRALPSTASDADTKDSWASMVVPKDTFGRIVKESRPFVLLSQYEHSGLEYLGLLLSSFTPNGDVKQAAPDGDLDHGTAAEVVTLFTALLTATLVQSEWNTENASYLLGRLSSGLHNEQDIVTVVSEVLEVELLAHLDQAAQPGSLELIVACIEFLNALVAVVPERVWSILVRSSLLGVQDGAVSLAAVVSGTEILTGRYRFLDACTKLHASLLDDALSGLVKRKAVVAKSSHRFAQDDNTLDVTPDRTMSAVLNSYQKILLDVLQNLPDWKFDVRQERSNITKNILDAFSKLLRSTYGVDVAKEPSKRLATVLTPAAEALLGVCAPLKGSSPLINTIPRLLPDCLPVAEDSLPIQTRAFLIGQTESTFRFMTIVLRATKEGIDLSKEGRQSDETSRKAAEQRTKNLASDLVEYFPLLVSLLVSDHSLKKELFPLLSELVEAIGSGDDDPPSVLAQLDTEAQKAFLSVTTQLDRPLCDVHVERRIWDFLTAVLGSKQHYFASFLLTGELPKKRGNRQASNEPKAKSILKYALDQLSGIKTQLPERANGMLEFVAATQRIWIWANNEIRSHPDFLKNTLAWIDTLGGVRRDPSPGASIIAAKDHETAANLCNIYAISIHAGIETGDKTVLKALIPKLNFLREHAVAVNGYNRSLHRNLAENLKRRFPHCDLSDFKRTAVNPAPYGPDFFYDRDLAKSALSHDVSWHGSGKRLHQGFSDEFARANSNLSLVDAQTKLLKSWKTLAITICELADQEPSSYVVLAQVAEKCLLANADPQLDEPGTADLLNERIELAFVLCSKVVSLKVKDAVAKDLLKAAWELVTTSPVDYDIATAPEDVYYYRELLQVLYLTIQPHSFVEKPAQNRAADETQLMYLAPEIGSILVNIVGRVVAPGFRALCGNIHTNLDLALPADFALLTALMQSVISTPCISSVYTLLSDIVADASLVRGALSLYSWSDQLAEATGHDPVFGEVAVLFLLALSTVPPIAEQMALGGVLSQLSNSNLSNYFRKPGGKGPFDEPQRMFVIWSEGFLPMCLNLLDAVGPPIAAEVGAFLNSFPEQLRRAERALRKETPTPRNPRAGAVTLGLVAEANSLSMISVILNSDVARAAAEGINASDIPPLEYDLEGVKNLMEALTRKRNLAERLTPVNPLEERWSKTTSGTENVLVQKALKEVTSMLACVGGSED